MFTTFGPVAKIVHTLLVMGYPWIADFPLLTRKCENRRILEKELWSDKNLVRNSKLNNPFFS
jgi:hypothetical protein